MTNMQIPVGFRRKARRQLVDGTGRQIFTDLLADEIMHRVGYSIVFSVHGSSI